MTKLLESNIEQLAIERLQAKRWDYLYGSDIAPDGENPLRLSFGDSEHA